MSKQKPGYVWYSFGSDKSGPALAEAIGFEAGKKKPDFSKYGVIVGWGCKPGKNYEPVELAEMVVSGRIRVLNNPAAVQRNRNKLEALKILANEEIPVPGFVEMPDGASAGRRRDQVLERIRAGKLAFPIVGLSKFGKSEPVFCYSSSDVARAVVDADHPCEFFRSLDQGEEYRVHVFRDQAITVERKRLADDPLRAASKSLLKKLKKKGVDIRSSEEALVERIVEALGAEMLSNASHLRKSTSMGWEFEECSIRHVSSGLTKLAIEALDALELDMGAVNISLVETSTRNTMARVLSVTTAPALSDDNLALYGNFIRSFSDSSEVPEKRPIAARKKKASPELMARLSQKIDYASVEKLEKALKILSEG